MDYAYTIQGWLKGVNCTNLSLGTDIWKDGNNNSVVARDVIGFALHYYDDAGSSYDYKPIGTYTTAPFARPNNTNFKSLYNGNIAGISMNNGGLQKGNAATTTDIPLFYNYTYDQLNRLTGMTAYKGLTTNTNARDADMDINDYKESITYDPNGNIGTYLRQGSPMISGKNKNMDNLSYVYYSNTNQLKQITDNTNYSSNYTEEIDNQTNSTNYTYDKIGNLKSDDAEGIDNIDWTVYGKIASITKGTTTINY